MNKMIAISAAAAIPTAAPAMVPELSDENLVTAAQQVLALDDAIEQRHREHAAACERGEAEGDADEHPDYLAMVAAQKAYLDTLISEAATSPAGLQAKASVLRSSSRVLNDYVMLEQVAASLADDLLGDEAVAVMPAARPATLVGQKPDPAFALIAEKLVADVAHCGAIDAQAEAELGGDPDAKWEADERCGDACKVVDEADWRLATTAPTTLAGVAAVLRFTNKIEDDGLEWPATDTIGSDGWHYQLRATMAAAIEARLST
jgi:hypothetical protein